MKTFALSRIWFRAQVLPLPQSWASKFESTIASFLWKGQQTKNLLSMETICLPCENGGLGIPFLRAKCDALLLKQMLRILASRGVSFDHMTFWINDTLQINDLPIFTHPKLNKNGRKISVFKSDYFFYLSELFTEGRSCERFSLTDLGSNTTKSIYISLTETMPPTPIVLKYPERNFPYRLFINQCIL